MQALRQLGGGVIVAIISVVLVLGGIFLSLAESLPTQATPTTNPHPDNPTPTQPPPKIRQTTDRREADSGEGK